MDKNAIKKYAVWARTELIDRVRQRAVRYEVTADANPNADSASGKVLTDIEKTQRQAAIARMRDKGYEYVIEEVAYTWFNRFAALRYMEVNNYLPSRVRVFTDENGSFKPQILTEAIHLNLDGLDMEKVYALKEAEDNDELYKYLLITQCNALSAVLPQMFKPVDEKCKQEKDDYTILLFPDNLLREGSVVEQMVAKIPEDNFNISSEKGQLEIIGWLYQYYISEKHEEVVDPLHGKVTEKDEVPAATQLFTTDWVVRYIVDNSLGRYWLERNPSSSLKNELEYFVVPKDGNIAYIDETITPQQLTFFDPCMGSAHFGIYAFDVLMKIYVEYGYSERDAATSIIENNLYGLDIDDRATQLAYFAMMMKACQYDKRFLTRGIIPHIYGIPESNDVDAYTIEYFSDGKANLLRDLKSLVTDFMDAKEYGTIIHVSAVDFDSLYTRLEEIKNDINIARDLTLSILTPLFDVAKIMSQKYAVVATNPPYLNKYDALLKKYVTDNYKDYSGDLFSVFMYRNFDYCIQGGYSGFMTPFVWMFIKTYEKLREYVVKNKKIATLIQFEYSAYEEATVPICTFVLKNENEESKGCYIRLSDFKGGMDIQKAKMLQSQKDKNCGFYYETDQKKFNAIPGSPIAFWVSDNMRDAYRNGKLLSEIASPEQGMATADNNRFVRKWYEPDISSVSFNQGLDYRWFPYNNGGGFRRWYGFNTDVVDWENCGERIKAFPKAYVRNERDYFKTGITWNAITSSDISVRFFEDGFIFSNAGMAVFTNDKMLKQILGFMNSTVAKDVLKAISPTLNYNAGDICNLPILMNDSSYSLVTPVVDSCIKISKDDWDTYEISWNFRRNPLCVYDETIEDAFGAWVLASEQRCSELKQLEEQLNSIFIEMYGLENEMLPEVAEKDISIQANTAYRYKVKSRRSKADDADETEGEIIEPLNVRMKRLKYDTIVELLSYAVGCMFGRYSLDVDGLAYAGGKWDETKYKTFSVDKDDIIPICDDEYFDDDITGLFVKFVETVYGKDTLNENLKFIADALGGKGTPKEVIRNYFLNDFFADHCKMYQKRPIYWLFDSGKKNGFKALVYMHRYQPDTIARMRTDYVHEQQSRYRTAIADLENRIAGASTSERVRLTKQLSKLQDQSAELHTYEEKIHHLADRMIAIDLDDGVKHNYELFQDVLAKIK